VDENFKHLQNIVEAALLASDRPLSTDQLRDLFPEDERPTRTVIEHALSQIGLACEGRGFELRQVASGYRFQIREAYASWVGRLWEEKPQRYSRALLETLALIAYRQPITRGEIEDVRGVAVSSNIVRTLQERGWIRVVGQRDVPGRPAMYATTREFLDYFNLKALDQLPSLAEIRDLDEIGREFEARLQAELEFDETTAETADSSDTNTLH
jgi:segregation and condensation protein B